MAFLQRAATRHALADPSSLWAFARSNTLNRRPVRLLIQTRNRSAAKTDKKAAISRAIAANQGSNEATADFIFGLRPVDYSIVPPIRYSPPAPPSAPGFRKYLFPLTLLFTAATVGYFYVNNKNDNYEYWKAMQSGEALHMDDGEDDDDDYEYEEEEE
mmetsp:Transcript_15433/g.33425  ORF Transcript_15433/g.33425 Transcript_15433/m.33425 type:complete len:158 (-) Transcript_15433:1576-2049(-)